MPENIKLPKVIRVGGILYSINPRSVSWMANESAVGQFDDSSHSIDIVNPQSQIKETETLLHELTHAILRNFSITKLEGLTEEEMCDVFEKGWLQIFIDNPAFIEYIKKSTEHIRNEQKEKLSNATNL